MINLQQVSVRRGPNTESRTALRELTLRIEPGQNTAVIGPNGAGKSTLLKLLARELYPASGSVELFGQKRWNVWKLRQRLGIVSPDLQQNYSPIATGFSVILSGFYSSIDTFGHQSFDQQQLATAEQIVGELGIEHLRDKPFSKMSTGEKRRHLLGRALVNDPETLVFDEPTNGLDLPATFQFFETVSELMRKGKTLVLVTHHIHEIPIEIDNIVLLKAGTVLAEGAKQDVLTDTNLSDLFDVPVSVTTSNGFFHVTPGSDS
jgi:iron complex transport system ATP-binding protein